MADPEVEAIDAELKRRGLKRADLARLLTLDTASVTRIFNGQRRLQRHEAKTIQEWFAGTSAASSPAIAAGGSAVLPMPGMVPLYGWVGAASESRLTLADQNLRGFVPMHPAQAHVRDPFALEVSDISMVPRYEPGEIVYLAPHRWPMRGQDCVIVTKDNAGFLKRYVRRDAENVYTSQFNPPLDLEFPTINIESVHSVVGRG